LLSFLYKEIELPAKELFDPKYHELKGLVL